MNTINLGTRIQETQMKNQDKQAPRMVTTKKRRGKRSAPTLPAGKSAAMDWKYVEADALNPSILASLTIKALDPNIDVLTLYRC